MRSIGDFNHELLSGEIMKHYKQLAIDYVSIGAIRMLAKSPVLMQRIEAAALVPACKSEKNIDEQGGPAQVLVKLMKDKDPRVRYAATGIARAVVDTRKDEFSPSERRFVKRQIARQDADAQREAKQHPADPQLESMATEALRRRQQGIDRNIGTG